MKKYLHCLKFKALLAATALVLGGCEGDELEPEKEIPTPEIPTIESVSIDNITEKSATAAIRFKDVETLYYTYYIADDEPARKEWTSVEVDDDATSLNIDFKSLEAESSYVALFYAENDDEKSDTKQSAFETLAPKIEGPLVKLAVAGEKSYDSAQIACTVYNSVNLHYAYYVKDQRPADVDVVWHEMEIEADGEVMIDIVDLPTNIHEATSYVAEVYSEDAAQKKSAVETVDFNTMQLKMDDVIKIENLKISAARITFDVDINEDLCKGFLLDYNPTDWGASTDVMVIYEEGNFEDLMIKEDTTIVIGKDEFLDPLYDYSVGIVALNFKDIILGEAIINEYSTLEPELGMTDKSLEITLDDSKTTMSSFTATVTRGDKDIAGYYFDYIEAEEVADGDLEAWIVSSNWFKYAFPDKGLFTEDSIEFVVDDELPLDTEYYAFCMPVMEDGSIGNLSFVQAKTLGLAFDETIKHSVEVTPSSSSADFKFIFGDKCDRIYYSHFSEGTFSDKAALDMLLYQIKWEYDYFDLADFSDGVATWTKDYLSMGENYSMFTIAMDVDGNLGELQKLDYTTPGITFDSEATVSIELVSEEYDKEYAETVLNFSVTMGNGAVKYIYAPYNETNLDDPNDMLEVGDYVIGKSYMKEESTDSTCAVHLYDVGYVVAFIPVDANGHYGMPIVYRK